MPQYVTQSRFTILEAHITIYPSFNPPKVQPQEVNGQPPQVAQTVALPDHLTNSNKHGGS